MRLISVKDFKKYSIILGLKEESGFKLVLTEKENTQIYKHMF